MPPTREGPGATDRGSRKARRRAVHLARACSPPSRQRAKRSFFSSNPINRSAPADPIALCLRSSSRSAGARASPPSQSSKTPLSPRELRARPRRSRETHFASALGQSRHAVRSQLTRGEFQPSEGRRLDETRVKCSRALRADHRARNIQLLGVPDTAATLASDRAEGRRGSRYRPKTDL